MKRVIIILSYILLCAINLMAQDYLTEKEYYQWLRSHNDKDVLYTTKLACIDHSFCQILDSIIDMHIKLHIDKDYSNQSVFQIECHKSSNYPQRYYLHVVETNAYTAYGEKRGKLSKIFYSVMTNDEYEKESSGDDKNCFCYVKGVLEYHGYTFAWYFNLPNEIASTAQQVSFHNLPIEFIDDNGILTFSYGYWYQYWYILEHDHLRLIDYMDANE